MGRGQNNPIGVVIQDDVVLPSESYGECSIKSCHTIDYLGDGLCEKCWDKKVWHNPWRTGVYGRSVTSVKQIYK